MEDRKAVIFDWGGVLMRTENRSSRLGWDHRLGLAPGSVESIVHGIDAWREVQSGKISLDSYWKRVGHELGIAPAYLSQLRQEFYQGDHLDLTLIALIENLREENILVGLLSNHSPDLAKILVEMDIRQMFDAVAISAHIGVMKPDERAYRAILDVLGVSPTQSIFIDDSEQNIQGARKIGMHGIHFTPGCDLNGHLAQPLENGE